MEIPFYLAVSASETGADAERIAWLSCHFSPWSSGLSNLPVELDAGSLLILDDSDPIREHDPDRIFRELEAAVERFNCVGLVLDWERATGEAALEMAEKLQCLPCPVYAPPALRPMGPVFLPPVPMLTTVEDHLRPWAGRKILLDVAPDSWEIHVTAENVQTAGGTAAGDFPHYDEALCCHYEIQIRPDRALFRLHRSKEDIRSLLLRAEKAGVSAAIGLWQELHSNC